MPGPRPGLVQITVSKLQEIPGNAWGGVNQEGQHVDLGVPEVVALVALARKTLGRNARALGPARRLDDLKQVKADRLLHGRVAAHMDITPSPEITQAAFLPLEQVMESVAHGAVQRALRPFAQLFRRRAPGRVIGHVLGKMDAHPRFRIDGKNDLARILRACALVRMRAFRIERMLDAAGQPHPAVGRFVTQHDAPITNAFYRALKHPARKAPAPTGVADRGLFDGIGLLIIYLRRNDHGCVGVQNGDLIRDRRQVPVLKRDEPARFDGHVLARRRLPQNLPVERPGLHVERAFEAEQCCGGKIKGLVVDVQPDDFAIRHVDDRLPGRGEPVGDFSVHDRPRLVKSVHEGSALKERGAFFEVSSHPEVPVCRGKERFRRREEERVKLLLHEPPLIGGIHILGTVCQFTGDHSSLTSQISLLEFRRP